MHALIERCDQHHVKAFDSVQLWSMFMIMDRPKIDQRGVRQGDTISPKLFSFTLEDIFETEKA